ncbi:MAG: TrkA family potassium uptake protein [Pseudomonadota bacterium]
MSEEYAVIGLGRFGRAVAMGLARIGKTVLAVDTSRDLVQDCSDHVAAAVVADATEESVLKELQIDKFSCAVVAMGENSLEAAIMATALLQQFGVPRIIARAGTDLQARVLRAAGAHEVVNPDAEMGRHLALRLSLPNIIDVFSLGEDAVVAEMQIPQRFVDKSLIELDLRNRYDISVLAVRRGDRLITNPKSGEKLRNGDKFIIIGSTLAIQKTGNLV